MARGWGQESESEKKLKAKIANMSFTEYMAYAESLNQKAVELSKLQRETAKAEEVERSKERYDWSLASELGKKAKALEYRVNQARGKRIWDLEPRAVKEMKKGDKVAKEWLIDYHMKKASEDIATAEDDIKEAQAKIVKQNAIIASLKKGIIPEKEED